MKLKSVRHVMGIFALVALVSTLSGCSKMLANFSLNQAEKRVKEARENDAQKFHEADLIKTEDLIATTHQQMNSGDFKSARQSGKEAATLAKDLLKATKESRASFLQNESRRWIGYVEQNEGNKEDANLYQKILQNNEAGNVSFGKQKWDDCNKTFDGVVKDCQLLLSNLKRKSEEGLADVGKMKEDLIAKGAREHNPDAIVKIDEADATIRDLIEVKVHYRLAIQQAEKAIQAGKEGIIQSYANQSEKLIIEIEKRLARATELGAEIYATESFNGVSGDHQNLSQKFYSKDYAVILNQESSSSGYKLLERADALIIETQRESANTKMKAVNSAIVRLTEGQAKVHLPGRVEKLEELYAAAKAKFEANEYTETERISLEGLEEERKLVDDFDKKTQAEIEIGRTAILTAKGVFEKMQGIFAEPSPLPLTGDDEAFEKNKLALREELGVKLEGGDLSQRSTTIMREDKDFNGAILASRRVAKIAEEVIQGTFHVVSHNAIQQVDNELTRYEREGGREYAPAEVDKAREMLDVTRELHRSGDFRKALEQGAETKAQVEILAQQLGRVAVAKIDSARGSITAAKESRGDRYQEGNLLKALQLAQSASDSLSSEGIKAAIKAAEMSQNIAEKAGSESLQQWSEEEMRRTDLLLARAREAGSATFAAQTFEEATNLRRNAQNLYDSGDYREAQLTATRAASTAENALYALVIQAEDEIASAKRFEGWKYENERLAQCIINAKYAREFLDQGNYDLSRRHAKHALETAHEVVVDAKKAGFHDRLVALNSKVEMASQKGVAYYQIGDLSKIVGEMNALATDFSPEGYEQAAQQMELIEAQLAGLMEMTPNVLQELVNRMNDSLSTLSERGAKGLTPDLVAQAERKIKFAQMDFNNGKYRPSFDNVKDAIKVINEIGLRLNERDYDLKISQHFMEFSKTLQEFAPILNMGSPILINMSKGPSGRNQAVSMMSATNPTDFRQSINDLAAQITLITPPPTRHEVHESTLAMLELARAGAGDFEKLLILDQYTPEDAKKIIERAYAQVHAARSRQQHIQAMLENPQTQVEQVGVRRALRMR